MSAEVKALAEKLATNDFPHVETRIERGLAEARADREAMETRTREEREAMEARLRRDAVAMEARIGERFDRMGGRIEHMEKRLLAAVQRRGNTDNSGSGP